MIPMLASLLSIFIVYDDDSSGSSRIGSATKTVGAVEPFILIQCMHWTYIICLQKVTGTVHTAQKLLQGSKFQVFLESYGMDRNINSLGIDLN
jgi:hypothetical protein